MLKTNADLVTPPVAVGLAASDAKQPDGLAAGPLATSEAPTTDPPLRKPPAIDQDEPSPLSFKIGKVHLTPLDP